MKLKAKKTLSKRVRITSTGKVMHKQSRMGHLKVKFDSSRKSRKNLLQGTDKARTKKIKRMLGV